MLRDCCFVADTVSSGKNINVRFLYDIADGCAGKDT